MSAATLARIQAEAAAWQRENFGEPDVVTMLLMLLGLMEEHGEAAESMADKAKYLDAIGDTTVYLMQFCSIRGWVLAQLWARRDMYEVPARAWPVLIGKIAHHQAKAMQRYRGSAEEHDERCRAAIGALLRHWERHVADMGDDFIRVVERTWAEVSARDWLAERRAATGHVPGCDGRTITAMHCPCTLKEKSE